MSKTPSSRPCSICRRWFRPARRVAKTQKTCSPACSKKLAAKRDAAWRARNPDYGEHRRLRAALAQVTDGADVAVQPAGAPLAKVPWRAVQVALGGKMAVVLAFALRLHVARLQVAFDGETRILTRAPVQLNKAFEQVPIGRSP